MAITLRAAVPEDEAFLLGVYASTRARELARAPWDETQKQAFVEMQFRSQLSYYREQFPEAAHEIILSDKQPVGRIYVSREEKEIRILDITLLPAHRNHGTGSSLLKQLLNEGEQQGKTVQIFVETDNPSLGLFRRLDFSVVDSDEYNLLLEWRPSSFRESSTTREEVSGIL